MKLQLCGVKVKRRKNYNTGQENGKDNQHHDRTARFNNNNNNPLVTTFHKLKRVTAVAKAQAPHVQGDKQKRAELKHFGTTTTGTSTTSSKIVGDVNVEMDRNDQDGTSKSVNQNNNTDTNNNADNSNHNNNTKKEKTVQQ